MTDEIKDKLKQMIDTSGVIASDVADYIIDLEDRIKELVDKKSFLEKENFKLMDQIEELKAQIIGLENNLRGHKARKNHYMKENEELKVQIEKMRIDNDEKLWTVNHQLEELLKLGKDKGVIKSWYTNGSYHWELAE